MLSKKLSRIAIDDEMVDIDSSKSCARLETSAHEVRRERFLPAKGRSAEAPKHTASRGEFIIRAAADHKNR